VGALVALQRALHAVELGFEDEARGAIAAAFDHDPALARDVDFLFWWLAPLRLRRLPAGGERGWRDAFGRPRASAADVAAAGASEGRFPFWFVDAAADALEPGAAEALVWALVGNELELGSDRRNALGAVARVARRPALLRDRRYAKVVLCGVGLWRPALGARERLTALRGG
jgi:hypothetical protein